MVTLARDGGHWGRRNVWGTSEKMGCTPPVCPEFLWRRRLESGAAECTSSGTGARPVLFVFVRRTHPDKVTLNRASRILKHAPKFSALIQDEEVNVEFARRTLVVSDLAGAVRVDNGLPCIDCRD